MNFRVGFGYDVHRLEDGRPFWLGGVKIADDRGAAGHSDADVLLHAICDALLGAANLGDIGVHFPDTRMEWKGKESSFFLKTVLKMIQTEGWRIANIDATVCLEAPRIRPYVEAMKKAIATHLGLPPAVVSVKATTNEGMGFVGRKEGVAAYAVALLTKD